MPKLYIIGMYFILRELHNNHPLSVIKICKQIESNARKIVYKSLHR